MEPSERASDSGSQTLATSLAHQLRVLITNGTIPPGEKLRLDQLRTTFGVSLSPLREALSRLSTEGFVTMEDQRGYRVAPVSELNLIEVMKLRAEIESFGLREAIRNGDDRWESEVVASLYRLNKLERSVPDTGDSGRVVGWEAAHRQFHQQLLSACRMPILMQFSTTLHDLGDRYRRLFLARNPIDRDVSEEHRRICDAAVARDADLACQLLRQHIERTGAVVLEELTSRANGRAAGEQPTATPASLAANVTAG